jgi:hypothetical protein
MMRAGVEVASVDAATKFGPANSSRERIRKLPPPEKTIRLPSMCGVMRPLPPGIRMTPYRIVAGFRAVST